MFLSRLEPLRVPLLKPPVFNIVNIEGEIKMGTPPDGYAIVKLTPRNYSKTYNPESFDEVYTVYSPPSDREYEDWEIELMRKACDSWNVRFQLHPPPLGRNWTDS